MSQPSTSTNQSGTTSSSSTAGSAMTEDQIRTKLTDDGYTGVTGLTKSGTGWKGTAMKDGKKVPVMVDQDGMITTGQAPRG
jgi:hypothetical protein